ncbi:MAG: hypothetical protein ACI9ON_003562 [Limisphaerales bacterium]|jgi:hypothetical protein
MRKFVALVLAVSIISPIYAQWFDWEFPLVPRTDDGELNMTAPVPRTADEGVDLSGLWVPVNASGSLYESSRLLGWARDAMVEAERSFYTTAPRFHCLPSGPGSYPAEAIAGGMRRIVQHAEVVAVLNEDMTHRQIYMDGRGLEAETLLPSWMGYSVGRWQGDTLIVESNGFNDKTWLTHEGLPHTDQLYITEHYTRLNYGHMELAITYEDPGTFVGGPVRATIDLVLIPEATMFEVVCNESKTGQRHYTGEMDQSEKKEVVVPEELLGEYVGVYQGVWGNRPITAEVTLENGELVLKRTPRYSLSGGNTDFDITRLVAQSGTAFDSSLGLGWVFNRNEAGEVTSVSEVHVSGAWPLERVE